MRKNIFFNLLLFCVIINLMKTQTCIDYVDSPDCLFYTKCLEETYNCGEAGFPLKYGDNYCNRLFENLEHFSITAEYCFQNSNLCLKGALFALTEYPNTNCEALKDGAWDVFPTCLVTYGYCSLFFDATNIIQDVKGILEIFNIVSLADKFMINQLISMTKFCGESVSKKLNETINYILLKKNNEE